MKALYIEKSMRLVCFLCCGITHLIASANVIVVPDYAPYADTIFPDRVEDYEGASFWGKIKYLLNEKKCKVSAVSSDELPKKLHKKDLLVCWSDAVELTDLEGYSPSQLALLMFQPQTITPLTYETDYLNRFSKVLTWNDDSVDGKKFYKFHYGVCYPMIPDVVPFSDRKLCCAMASNKTSEYECELYSERKNIFTYFDQYPDEFDLYGLYWETDAVSVYRDEAKRSQDNLNNNECSQENTDSEDARSSVQFNTYKGWVDDKIQTLKNYKFSICFENTKETTGYITEKIFDCFQAGVIPVYFGAPNITDDVPSDCFIDWRNFSSYDDLRNYLISITEEEFEQYLVNIRTFLSSDQAAKYTPSSVAMEIVNALTAD